LITYRQAQETVLARAHGFGREKVALDQVLGRVLAEPISADRPYPPFNRASMDGYAVRFEDLQSGIQRFRVVDTIFAGGRSATSAVRGDCYRIMTGAAVPADTDTIIRREDIKEGGGEMWLAPLQGSEPWRPYQNIARQGEDLAAGDVVIANACVCGPAVVGLLATLGRTEVTVARRPRIALLTTGDEVVPVGAPVGPVQIRNSNRWLLEAALKKEGIGLTTCVHAPDETGLLLQEVERLLTHDILILSGGVSAGDADHVPATLEALGVQKLFHKMAIRPGKPTWCGVTPTGNIVFALPGNPFSTLVNMVLLIRPYLRACDGLPPEEPLGLPLEKGRSKRTPLDEFFPAIVHGSPARVSPVGINGSGDIRLGMTANALALHPAGSGDLPAGAEVGCYSFV
jgi:molybdopterin molybdotransferase